MMRFFYPNYTHPQREDLAETMGPYLATRHRSATSLPNLATRLKNRFAYLDRLGLTMNILP